MADQNGVRPLTLPEVFPPGRRRKIVIYLSQHPEFDEQYWNGRILLHMGNRDGEPTVTVEPTKSEKL